MSTKTRFSDGYISDGSREDEFCTDFFTDFCHAPCHAGIYPVFVGTELDQFTKILTTTMSFSFLAL